jgi:hypothetical protein
MVRAVNEVGLKAKLDILFSASHNVVGHDLDQFKTDAKQTILWPAKYATGSAIYPYTIAKE